MLPAAMSLCYNFCSKSLYTHKAEVVQFGALALLNNPLLGHVGKRGKDLRAQLKSMHSSIAPTDKPQDWLLVGDALQKRMSMVLKG